MLLGIAEMENNIQALANEKHNRSFWRLPTGATKKRYHGFQYGDGRIIESHALRDKRSCKGKAETLLEKASRGSTM
jgi:hypothetical protein